MLALELRDLQGLDFDLSLTGLDDADISSLINEIELGDEEKPADNALVHQGQEVPERLLIMVECRTDRAQRELLERLTKEGWECRALTS